MKFIIRQMIPSDWGQVKEIYEEGIKTKNATFETIAPSYEKWMGSAHPGCHLIVEEDFQVLAWAKVLYTSARPVYAGVGEVSIYVHPKAKGRGIGKHLLSELILVSEQQGFWTLKASIFPENESSIQLHKKCGFRILGIHEKIGEMDGVWRDNIIMERRSDSVGVDK
ncbi:GNAT family N-acetyltransferase [Paenisporosarcina sp. TG-14]|uniref:GNAT family N-acetyltransferase n=1 Tax=Paenisporosarcina sp. TG-14 TaxID=1231057 RepID=UPI00030C315F|nr:GNAT family N-acetyltransferase [Paenisporosarcina sp. TG-14]